MTEVRSAVYDVIRVLVEARRPMTAGEIAEKVGIPKDLVYPRLSELNLSGPLEGVFVKNKTTKGFYYSLNSNGKTVKELFDSYYADPARKLRKNKMMGTRKKELRALGQKRLEHQLELMGPTMKEKTPLTQQKNINPELVGQTSSSNDLTSLFGVKTIRFKGNVELGDIFTGYVDITLERKR